MDDLLPKYCVKKDGTIKLGLYCLYCESIKKNLQDMSRHLITSHPKNAVCHILLEDRKEPKFFEEPRFKCPKCPYYNREIECMSVHWKLYHKFENEITYKKIELDKNNPVRCIKCGNKYFNKLMAALHWKVTHGTDSNPVAEVAENKDDFSFKVINQYFLCGNVYCQQSFHSYEDFNRHYERAATHKKKDFNFIMVRQDVSNYYLEYVYPEEDIYKCDSYKGCTMEFGKNKYDAFYHHLDKHFNEQERFVFISHGKDGFASWEKVLLKSLFPPSIDRFGMKNLFK